MESSSNRLGKYSEFAKSLDVPSGIVISSIEIEKSVGNYDLEFKLGGLPPAPELLECGEIQSPKYFKLLDGRARESRSILLHEFRKNLNFLNSICEVVTSCSRARATATWYPSPLLVGTHRSPALNR